MDQIENAIQILTDGGIVIFPTDTAFAISCRIDKPQSVEKLFRLRKRAETKAVPVLVNSWQMAGNYWRKPIPQIIIDLTNKYWPGGLTIIYYAEKNLMGSRVLGGGTTIGLRMPGNEIALALIAGVGVALVGTSANFAGAQTPYSFDDLDSDLTKLVDCVVEGTCKSDKSSTIVDCTFEPFKIVRKGMVEL